MKLNATASRAAKQAGQQLALDMAGDWKADVLVELRAWIAVHRGQGNREMTMEQFRAQAVNQPTSHKAWGALPAIACKAGLIEPVLHDDGSAVMRRAASVRTHAHPVRLWRIVDSSFAPAAREPANYPSAHDADGSLARRQPVGVARVSDGRHSHCGEGA